MSIVEPPIVSFMTHAFVPDEEEVPDLVPPPFVRTVVKRRLPKAAKVDYAVPPPPPPLELLVPPPPPPLEEDAYAFKEAVEHVGAECVVVEQGDAGLICAVALGVALVAVLVLLCRNHLRPTHVFCEAL